MFVVTGATGRTGAGVASQLLKLGHDVRVVVRSKEAAALWLDKGANVAIADFNDELAVTEAFRGASGVYIMTPPLATAPDLLAAREPIEANLLTAVKENEVPHVAVLSALGAHHEAKTGQIVGLHRMENKFLDVAANCTVLRAAYFLDNWAPAVSSARNDGTLMSFVSPTDLEIEQISTRGVASSAVRALLEPPLGNRVIAVAGVQKISAETVAEAVGLLLGKQVRAASVPKEKWDSIWEGLGWSADRRRLYAEFFEGLGNGHVSFSGQEEFWRVDEDLESVLRDML